MTRRRAKFEFIWQNSKTNFSKTSNKPDRNKEKLCTALEDFGYMTTHDKINYMDTVVLVHSFRDFDLNDNEVFFSWNQYFMFSNLNKIHN